MDAQVKDFLLDAANVALGWVLGLGSAVLSDWRKDRKRAKAVKAAISRELRETAYRMLVLVYQLGGRHGEFNREFFQWMQPQVEAYGGPNPKDGFLEGIEKFLKQSDAQLAALSKHAQETTPPLFIPSEAAPFTSTAISELHDYEPDYTVRVLDILSHIRMFNEAGEKSLYYTRLTFTPELSSENVRLARSEVVQAEVQSVKRARIIIDKITELERRHLQ